MLIFYKVPIIQRPCGVRTPLGVSLASLVAQTVKCLRTVLETRVRSLCQEDLLEKEMATHSSTLA